MNSNAAAAFYLLREAEEPMTTADVAQVVFSNESTEELRNAERKVRYYFEDSYEHLTECAEADDGTVLYDVDDESVWVGTGVMQVVTDDAEAVEVPFGDVLVYLNEDDVPKTVQLGASEDMPTVEQAE